VALNRATHISAPRLDAMRYKQYQYNYPRQKISRHLPHFSNLSSSGKLADKLAEKLIGQQFTWFVHPVPAPNGLHFIHRR